MDTIVAISTAPGVGGIGIIRMSGKNCFDVLDKIFKQRKKQEIENIKGYSMKYGHIIDKDKQEIIDEVLVSYFKEPYSYTTENMCEINSHGGIIIMRRILELCLNNGAKMAEPGEFTKRAFLNGRIDLSQAEAIIDIINSKTEKESKASINQLEGFLSRDIRSIRDKVLDVMSDIEASIDYPEYDIEEITNGKILKVLQDVKEQLKKLESTFYNGKIIKEGIKVAIIGKPNAGKSSLLNAMLKENRAIVTEYEGTTRDTIEEFIDIDGIPIKIIDTAGIRNARDQVEQIGIKKAKEIAIDADIVIAIFDITRTLDDEDEKILKLIKEKRAIIVLNKIDLGEKEIDNKILEAQKPIVRISAREKVGIEELNKEISNIFKLQEINFSGETLVTNVRHKKSIQEALENTCKAIKTLEDNMPIDIIGIYIKEILECLGDITGENVSENIIKEIFSKFCLGK